MVTNRLNAATACLIVVFTALMGLLMIVTFIVAGNVFDTTERDFNVGMAFGAAVRWRLRGCRWSRCSYQGRTRTDYGEDADPCR